MTKILTDELFLLGQSLDINFVKLLEIINEAAKDSSREDHVASAVYQKLLDIQKKRRKIGRNG